jgi:Protein of unknown function (DUF1569)
MPTSTRRTLRFETLDQVLTDVSTLVDADANGKLHCCGNWTLGQNLNHLATWVDYSYDGAPMKIPFFVPWITRPFKNIFLTKPMKPGAKIPKVTGGTLATNMVSTADGLAHIQKSFTRLASEVPVRPHVLFGKMNHKEWIAQHLRHAELHLSFMTADSV